MTTVRFDLRAGAVDPNLFPLNAWRRCATAAMRAAPPGYGDPTGADDLRGALAHWIGRTRGVVASAEEVVVTSGALHGMDLVARAMVGPGDVVAVEEPGYPPAVELLRSHGLAAVGVPVDADGLVVDAIPPSAASCTSRPRTSTRSESCSPTNGGLSCCAGRRDMTRPFVEDDYDSHLRYAARPLEPLQRLDPDGRVVYLGTFSKVLSPSLRVGFAVVPRSIIPAVTALRETVDWCPPWPTQPTLTRLIVDGHLDQHIARARWQYRARRDEIVRRLRCSPVPVRPLPSSAGLHVAVLVDGDDTADDHALHEASVAEDMLVGSLRRCYRFSTPPAGLLVGFGSLHGRSLAEAMDALDRLLLRLVARRTHGPTPADSLAWSSLPDMDLVASPTSSYGRVVASVPTTPEEVRADVNRTSDDAQCHRPVRRPESIVAWFLRRDRPREQIAPTVALATHRRPANGARVRPRHLRACSSGARIDQFDSWPNHDVSLHHHAGGRATRRAVPGPAPALPVGAPLRVLR